MLRFWCLPAALGLLVAAGCSGGDGAATDSSDLVDSDQPAPLEDEYAFSDEKLFPESGGFDPVERAFFVGSLGRGNITRVSASGEESIFYEGTGESGRLTLGVQVDPERRRLWVCTVLDEGHKPGIVWVFDLGSGEMKHEFALDLLAEKASCNDIAVDAQGRAYVTDRENPNVYLVDLEAGEMQVWASSPLLEASLVGLNGAAVTPDGATLIVTTYLPARLIRIPLADPTKVAEIDLDGDPFWGGWSVLSGADGIEFLGDVLYVAFNSKVMRVTPEDSSWQAATVTARKVASGVTSVVAAEGDLFAVNGQATRFALGHEPDSFRILRFGADVFDPVP